MLEGLRPYETQPTEPGRAEKITRPVAERSAEPGRRRDGEADFFPIDQLAWHAPIQRLPKDPLSPPVADLETAWKSPAELHQTVVEQGDPRLEAHRHAGPVHLGEEVVWQVAALVREHHPLHQLEDELDVGEGHLHIELRQLLNAVGAEVLVPEAARDLEIALEAGDHEELLEDLRRLRQREEAAGLEP